MKKEWQTVGEWAGALNDSGKGIIVEGINDEKALRRMGVDNRVYQLTKKPLFAVVEEVADGENEVVILTDLDKEGKRLYRLLLHDLSQHGVHIDRFFREWLFRNSKVAQVEGLKTTSQ